ncbi:MAG: hypothetical protein JAY96_14090, partial [Candidatus Thiodiazotropha endolucinida]|nr:hypothetical protein [Candidatus Thiodiazotropha taylori]MCW4249319.1 hypothetical protein [Candidatus Thiodiazotropha endolucinida]
GPRTVPCGTPDKTGSITVNNSECSVVKKGFINIECSRQSHKNNLFLSKSTKDCMHGGSPNQC